MLHDAGIGRRMAAMWQTCPGAGRGGDSLGQGSVPQWLQALPAGGRLDVFCCHAGWRQNEGAAKGGGFPLQWGGEPCQSPHTVAFFQLARGVLKRKRFTAGLTRWGSAFASRQMIVKPGRVARALHLWGRSGRSYVSRARTVSPWPHVPRTRLVMGGFKPLLRTRAGQLGRERVVGGWVGR